MAKIECILLKPLDGRAIGSRASFSNADYQMLRTKGAVKKAPPPRNKAAPNPENK